MGSCEAILNALVDSRPIDQGNLNEDMRWDVMKFTDSMLLSMVQVNSNIFDLASIISSATARTKVNYKPENAKNSEFKHMINQRGVNIALTTILDTLKSDKDIMTRDGVNPELVTKDTVAYNHICQIIGRQYLNSLQKRVAKGSPSECAMLEKQQGEMVIEQLVKEGYLEVTQGAKVVYNGQRNENGDPYIKINASDKSEKSVLTITGLTLTQKFQTLEQDKKDATISHARAVTRMLNPTREILPNTEPSANVNIENSRAHGNRLTNKMIDTFNMLSQGARQIHPVFIDLLKELSTQNKEGQSSFDTIRNKTLGTGVDFKNMVFGTERPLRLVTDYKVSESGVARTKSSNMVNVLDNLKELINEDGSPKDLFFDYFAFRTGRSLANQNILNAQTDKHFARPITTSEPIDVLLHSEAFYKILGALSDDYKSTTIHAQLSYNEITKILESPEFLSYKTNYIDKSNPISEVDKLNAMDKVQSVHIKMYDSVFDKIKGIGIAYEILTGMQENILDKSKDSFKSTFDVAPDASGSGLFINLIQSLTKGSTDPKVREVLQNMGFLPKDKDHNGNDVYSSNINSLYSYIGNMLSEALSPPKIPIFNKQGVRITDAERQNILDQHLATMKSFQNDYDLLQEFTVLNFRDLAKMPVMTMGAYNQEQFNAQRSIAKELVWSLLQGVANNTTPEDLHTKNSSKFNMIHSILKTAVIINQNKDLTLDSVNQLETLNDIIEYSGTVELLENYFSRKDGLANKLVQLTNEHVKEELFGGIESDINYVYKVTEDFMKSNGLNPADLKILSPQFLIDNNMSMEDLMNLDHNTLVALTKKWGLPLSKRVEAIDNNGNTIMKEVMNKPSWFVSTTHMVDGATQHIALHNSLKEYYSTYGKFPGVVPIHDATNSNANFAVINDKNYIKANFEINMKWDKVQMLILAAKAMGINTDAFASIQHDLSNNKEAKKEAIQTIYDNLNQAQQQGNAKVYGYKKTTELDYNILDKFLDLQDLQNLPNNYKNMYFEIKNFFRTNPQIDMDTLLGEFQYNPNIQKIYADAGLENVKDKVKFLYHEVIHAYTNDYIDTNFDKSLDIKYIAETIRKLNKNSKLLHDTIEKLYTNSKEQFRDTENNHIEHTDYLHERFDYILEQSNNKTAVKEFIAIIQSEPEVRKAFLEIVADMHPETNKDTLVTKIKNILKSVRDFIVNKAMLRSYMNAKDINAINTIKLVQKIDEQARDSFEQKDGRLKILNSYNYLFNTPNKEGETFQQKLDQALTKHMNMWQNNMEDFATQDEYNQAIAYQIQYLTNKYRAMYLKANPEATDVTMDDVLNATAQTQTNARKQAQDYKEYFHSGRDFDDPFAAGTRLLNNYARQVVMMSLENYGVELYENFITNNHKRFMLQYPIYKATIEVLQDAKQNEVIQQIVHYSGFDNFKDRNVRTQLLAKIREFEQERNKYDNTYVRKLSDLLDSTFTKDEQTKIYTAYAKSGIFYLNQEKNPILLDLLANDPTVMDDDTFLDNYINKYIADNGLVHDKSKAENLASIVVNSKVKDKTSDNLRAYGLDKAKAIKIETLASLYALRMSGGLHTIRDTKARNPKAHDEMMIVITGMKAILNKLESQLGSTESSMSFNIVADLYQDNFEIIPVDLIDYNKGLYQEDWQVLRKPEVGKLGLVYRKSITTTQPGLTTSNNFTVDGLVLSEHLAKTYSNALDNNAVTTWMGQTPTLKIIFSEKEKATLGLLTNPAESLYRTYSHIKFLNDTQPIREALVSKVFNKTINDKVADVKDLEDTINNPDVEHAWFLNINGAIPFHELPKSITDKYKPVGNLTRLGRMSEKITHVRKDISPWLVGYVEPDIFGKSYKMNRVAVVIKKLFTMQKLHWVIVNPVKISKDLISNTTYLISRNVPITKIIAYTPRILEGLAKLTEYRNELVAAKLILSADENNLSKQKRVKDLEDAIKGHEFGFVFKNGYVSSLSTDMILKDNASMTGLEHDINSFIDKVARDRKGDLNSIGKFIMKVGKFGISTEDILSMVGNALDKNKSTEGTAKLLHSMAEELTRIKDKDDVAKYVSQFIASPGSEAVKMGSAAIQTIEVLSKVILHMHLKDIGKSEDEAIQDVTDSFFDYTVNMPMAMKVLSDLTITLFPTFWARIQRVIYLLGRDNPVSLITALIMSETLGLDSSHIVNTNLVNKFMDGSIINSPELTIDAIFATKII